ncbi:MAG TPA: DUF4160 domain-containing protein [Longimicrobium sp.]|jgi:hypothetical protein
MPTVHREDGFRVVIWPNDHRPPHVHVFTAAGEAVIELDPIRVREYIGMKPSEVVGAIRIVDAHRKRLNDAWEEIHGT